MMSEFHSAPSRIISAAAIEAFFFGSAAWIEEAERRSEMTRVADGS